MIAGMRLWIRLVAVLLVGSVVVVAPVSAQPEENKKTPAALTLPAVLNKPAPETVEDLRDLENHVQKVLEKVMPSVVGVRVGFGQGSGVIVKEDGTILTAGHVSGKPNRTANVDVILPSGKKLGGKTLGQNGGIDSGMMKILREDKYPFVEMGKSSDLKKGQWVIAIGHPGGFRPNRTPVVRVGRILFVHPLMIRTDCTLVGGDSGGPLFDMQGRVIGIHSRIGSSSITENVHVPIDTYHQTWDRLAKGESWNGQFGKPPATVESAGGKTVYDEKDRLSAKDAFDKVRDRGPEKKDCYCKIYPFKMKAGATYTIDLTSLEDPEKLDVYLRLESPEGKQLAFDDDGAGFPNSRIVYKASKDGEYRIIATSFEKTQTGRFRLKILEADFQDSFASGKIEILRAIRLPGMAVGAVVDAYRQRKQPLHINAVLVDEKGGPVANKSITFQWDKGEESVKSNGEGIVRWPLRKDRSKKLVLDLPPGTRALLTLTDPEGNGVNLSKEDIAQEKVKSAGGNIVKTIDGTLAEPDAIDRVRDKCHCHVHEFKMQAGKTYTLDLVSEDFDAYLRLENAEQKKLAEDDDGAGLLNSRIVFTPTADGVFRIVVTTCDPGQTGEYRLTIRETEKK